MVENYDYNQTRSFNFGLAQELGIEAALVFDELAFWTTKSKNGWLYKSYEDMGERLALSKFKLSNAYKKLEEAGYIEVELHKANGAPTLHFRLLKNFTMESKKTSQSIESKKTSQSINSNSNSNSNTSIKEKYKKENELVTSLLQEFKQSFNRERCEATPKRTKMLLARLAEFTPEQLSLAIKNCAASPWHQGENDRGWRASPEYLFRNAEVIEEWLERKPAKPKRIFA